MQKMAPYGSRGLVNVVNCNRVFAKVFDEESSVANPDKIAKKFGNWNQNELAILLLT